MRPVFLCLLGALLLAPSASAQVLMEARLEKPQVLSGEPVFVQVDLVNSAAVPVAVPSCPNFDLVVQGAVPRGAWWLGCRARETGIRYCGMQSLGAAQRRTYRMLLTGYDLAPGQYRVTVSASSLITGSLGDGRISEQTLELQILPTTDAELRAALGQLVTDADGTDGVKRQHARDAIFESAPASLEALIARLAKEDHNPAAIDALGRIATLASRGHLRELLDQTIGPARETTILALAQIGHPEDRLLFARELLDLTRSEATRQYAAAGLGRIGDSAIGDLLAGLESASGTVREIVFASLGKSGSRSAVPALIGFYRSWHVDSVFVCQALQTLTRKDWCVHQIDDGASQRRKWLRAWQRDPDQQVYRPQPCLPELPFEPPVVAPRHPEPPPTRRPSIVRVWPKATPAGATIELQVRALGSVDSDGQRVMFFRGDAAHWKELSNGRYDMTDSSNDRVSEVRMVVPRALEPGRWKMLVERGGVRSAAVSIDIVETPVPQVARVSPKRAHPSESVFLETIAAPQATARAELTDARGTIWDLETTAERRGTWVKLPEDAMNGPATLRLVDAVNDHETQASAPFPFEITSGPLPLRWLVPDRMNVVAAGQWTNLDLDDYFEVTRADRVEVEFSQTGRTVVGEAVGWDNTHVQVPAALTGGRVSLRTRTWIDRDVSDWSEPVTFRIARQAVAPRIDSIDLFPEGHQVWWRGRHRPASVTVKPRAGLLLSGQFPTARVTDVRVHLVRPGVVLELDPMDEDSHVHVAIPANVTSGRWKLLVGTEQSAMRGLTTVIVQ